GGHTSQHLVQMAREWGWSELDLQWEVNLHGTDGPPVSVLAFEDDVDMQGVLDSLTEEGTAGGEKPGGTEARPQFHLPLAVGAIRPFLDATVLPDRKLLVVGSPDDETHQAVLARLDGEQAAPSDAVTALVGPIGPTETLLV